MQRLTATVELVVNRLKYVHIQNNQRHNKDNNKLKYHETIIDTLKQKDVELHTCQLRQQRMYRMVIRNLHHSVQQELVREDIE
jgi:hypothetical protein